MLRNTLCQRSSSHSAPLRFNLFDRRIPLQKTKVLFQFSVLSSQYLQDNYTGHRKYIYEMKTKFSSLLVRPSDLTIPKSFLKANLDDRMKTYQKRIRLFARYCMSVIWVVIITEIQISIQISSGMSKNLKKWLLFAQVKLQINPIFQHATYGHNKILSQ